MRRAFAIAIDAFHRFLKDDGWAIASHIALSILMAMFPFLIVVTALAAFLGSNDLANAVANLLLDTWPQEVADPLGRQVERVLTTARGDALTLGAVFAIYFASSGVESLRIGLNRAYGVVETRNWLLLRLESIAYVLVGAVALLAMAFLVVLGPVMFSTGLKYAPWLEPLEGTLTFWRYVVASVAIVVAVVVAHKGLPAGRRRFGDIATGIVVTLAMWLVGGYLFGRYLADYAFTYRTYYAGLATAMIALVFLYLTASIFMYGGELNSAIKRARDAAREPAA